MDAYQLLQSIEARGGVATVKTDATGAAKINVAPRSLALDLLPDLQRFKPALLELLTAPEAPATPSPFRAVAPFLLVPVNIETAPGAAKICSTLQTFRSLFEAARDGDLPQQPFDVEIGYESHTVENVARLCIELEKVWSDRARICQWEQRDLTAPESAALESAGLCLENFWSRFDGPGAAWLNSNAP